ncbi:hypothetical protein BGZ83_008482 [Gryganskiella cystojenkinii]|nr:hypothetical protein BGZ83_008482 [Gryganskiella cystojenkinii]
MVPEPLNRHQLHATQMNPLASKLHHSTESEYQLPFDKTMIMDEHSVRPELLSEKLHQIKQQQLTQQPNGRHSHHSSSASSASHHSHLSHHRHHDSSLASSSSSNGTVKKSPQVALQEILVRIDKTHHERELEKEKEREQEAADTLRRQQHRNKMSPDLLKDHLPLTLKQNHGNANLRHS